MMHATLMTEEQLLDIFHVVIAHGFTYEPIVTDWGHDLNVSREYYCKQGMRLAQGGRTYYFYPTTNKWRAKGKTKFYRCKGIEDLFAILSRSPHPAPERPEVVSVTEMPFGKYKGQPLVDIVMGDKQYLFWFLDNLNLPAMLRTTLTTLLAY